MESIGTRAKNLVSEVTPDDGFWKSDTQESYELAVKMMLAAGMEDEDALFVLEGLVSATKSEYGD